MDYANNQLSQLLGNTKGFKNLICNHDNIEIFFKDDYHVKMKVDNFNNENIINNIIKNTGWNIKIKNNTIVFSKEKENIKCITNDIMRDFYILFRIIIKLHDYYSIKNIKYANNNWFHIFCKNQECAKFTSDAILDLRI